MVIINRKVLQLSLSKAATIPPNKLAPCLRQVDRQKLDYRQFFTTVNYR